MVKQKATLNTTINKNVMDNFRDYCEEIGYPMNIVLESFMTQFTSGEFILKIGRNEIKVDIEE